MISILDKTDFKTKVITIDKEGYLITINGRRTEKRIIKCACTESEPQNTKDKTDRI